jgi:3-hydroxyisobutyryl-CoA hydrolase
VTGEAKKYLGSGGDLVLTTEKIQEIPEFMRCLHHMFYLTSKVKSISLWTGYVIGASAGLACSSVTKVAFPSSKYLMPETEIGLFPNVGGSYFLSHHLPQHIGLYLGLTGHTLKGADCFLYGLCQFFVLDEDYDALVNELFLGNPLKTLEKFHREPLWRKT